MLTERQTEKIKKVQEELKKGLVKTDKESVFFDYFKLHGIPLLNDQTGFKKILEVIEESSGGKVSWHEVIGQRRAGVTAANPEPELFAPEPVGLEIHVEDPSKVDEYFSSILKKSNTENSEIEIVSLHINRHEDGSRITVIINERYSDDNVQPLARGGSWKKLLEVAENGFTEVDTEKEAKRITDYFNTNKQCRIYTAYPRYKLTKIIKQDEREIFPNIKIEIVPQRAFVQRKNKTA